MIKIAAISKESIVDGEGMRMTVFLQGCKHNCIGCHNPETHDFNGGEYIDAEEILNNYDNRLDGITLSGGDPLYQAKEIIGLVKEIERRNINLWIYTGFSIEEILGYVNGDIKSNSEINDDMIEVLKHTDVLVDGRFVEQLRTLDKKFVGSSNQRLIDIKKTLKDNKIVEYTEGE